VKSKPKVAVFSKGWNFPLHNHVGLLIIAFLDDTETKISLELTIMYRDKIMALFYSFVHAFEHSGYITSIWTAHFFSHFTFSVYSVLWF